MVGAIRAEETRRTQPTQPIKQGSWGLTEAGMRLLQVLCIHAVVILTCFFVGLLIVGAGVSDPFACSWDSSPPIELLCLALL